MNAFSQFPNTRLRRLRRTKHLRNLVKETQIDASKLIMPLFIRHGENIKNPIESMPGHFQLSLDKLVDEIKIIISLGIKNVVLFGIPAQKNAKGTDAYSADGIIQQAIQTIKNIAPDIIIISDICFCEYMDHGHCGVLKESEVCGEVNVDNDSTLELLAKLAVSHAQAGSDMIAPSGNMDGMVKIIREALDEAGFSHIPILSYSVKYATSLYGPFRLAVEGELNHDRRTYQMDYANGQEALRECSLDIGEGADILMVKPAHTYLDVIYRVKHQFPSLPLCAYHTSGEFAMIKAAALQGWLDERECVLEVLTAIHRAGADLIITYFAKDVAKWLIEK